MIEGNTSTPPQALLGPAREAAVRSALRVLLASSREMDAPLIDEFWIPRSHERADMALVDHEMMAFEIKTEPDSLRRLPRQVAAYNRLFDRCTAVVAHRHLDRATALVPEWWGVTAFTSNGSVSFSTERPAQPNEAGVDPQVLVRLLRRDEAAAALESLGRYPEERSGRSLLWSQLLEVARLDDLRKIVRSTIQRRHATPGPARRSRFTRLSDR